MSDNEDYVSSAHPVFVREDLVGPSLAVAVLRHSGGRTRLRRDVKTVGLYQYWGIEVSKAGTGYLYFGKYKYPGRGLQAGIGLRNGV